MKKIVSLILVALLLVSCLAGCGKKTDDKTIKVGASPAPHAEILGVVKDALAAEGYTLEVVEYNDYVLPNTATESGELDANYFQHQPYLDDFNAENGTHLVTVCQVHYEPFGIYAGSCSDLASLEDGATVLVPNDTTNEARALQLLQQEGLIILKDGVGLEATKLDIVENPKNLDIREIEAAQLVRSLPDCAVAVINGNYAIEGGLLVSEALAVESADSDAAQTFANILVVKEGNENAEKIQALAKALLSDDVKAFIEETYNGSVVAIF